MDESYETLPTESPHDERTIGAIAVASYETAENDALDRAVESLRRIASDGADIWS